MSCSARYWRYLVGFTRWLEDLSLSFDWC